MDFLEANRASRLQHEARLRELERGGRVIGSPMSPTPPPYPGEQLSNGRAAGPPMSPLGPDADDDDDARSAAKKKKKKKKKRRKSLDSDAINEVPVNGDHDAGHASPKKSKKSKKKKSRNNEPNGVQSPDAQHLLVSHPLGGSPPSGQQPVANGVESHGPTLETEAAEQESIPGNSVDEIEPAHLKTEPESNENGVPDHELPFRIAADSIVDGDDPRQKSPFMHKREMSIVDGEPDLESDDEAPLPDLQPSQIKPEPPSSESESDLGSPSVARLGRLERSRSRSISRPPPTKKPVGESLDTGNRAASNAPSRSSTGSNQSIPARAQDARPASRSSTHSSGRHDSQLNGDAMDVDDQDFGNGNVSSPKKKARRPKSAKKPTSHQQAHDARAEASDAEERPGATFPSSKRSARKGRHRQSDNAVANTEIDKVTNWLSQPAKRRTHADVVEESDNEAAAQNAQADAHNFDEDAEETEEAIQQQLQEQIHTQDAEAAAEIEPEVSASQPTKAKKKRRLQSKESLSLSQLEDDFGEGDTQSRVSISQRSKLKDIMRGDGDSPEDETGTNLEPFQEPTVPKQIKPKRKRRTNDASDDELENLLAGPSRRKKSKKTSKSVGPSDHEKTAATSKKKRLSQGEMSTGAWTTEELSALGQVVDQFRRAYDMTQPEVNALIHQRPEMTNPLHKDFWDNAVAAIHKRTKKQIVERTRRLYNNFVGRGRWDEEQKKELHELFGKHGTKFAEIASLINRDQKDVRDYWRNQYVVHEHQRKWYWKPDETEKLKQAVEEALTKIQINRENNDQFRPRPRAKGFDDESLLDWQQISSTIGLTRNRQQCKWKWQEMKDKGEVGVENDHLPEASRQPRTINGLSEVLANAREDYRVMSVDEQLQLVEAVHDSGAAKDSKIKWKYLVDERFRAKWRRSTLKLVWFRLRKAVPDHEDQDVQSNARYLINYYNIQQSLPRIEDHQADEQVEEKLVNTIPGSKVWQTPSQEPRAVRERQRRSSSASSRASSRASEKVSSKIVRLAGSDDEQRGEPAHRGRDQTPRSGSVDLGEEDVEGAEEQQQRKKSKGKGKSIRRKKGEEAVPVRIPKHLHGEAAEQEE